MNRKEIIELLKKLNNKLKKADLHGEIYLYGGAVMCLVFKTRNFTHDIDAVFEPKSKIYDLIYEISEEENVPQDWLNDSVKGFISMRNEMIAYSGNEEIGENLNVMTPVPEYLFAMKAMSSRTEHENEIEDIKFLIKEIGIKTVSQAEEIISKYYPSNMILPKTHYMLSELMEN